MGSRELVRNLDPLGNHEDNTGGGRGSPAFGGVHLCVESGLITFSVLSIVQGNHSGDTQSSHSSPCDDPGE